MSPERGNFTRGEGSEAIDDSESMDVRKMVLQTVAVIVAMGVLLWLVKGNGGNQIASLVKPHSTPSAVTPAPLRALNCLPSQIEISGAVSGCADPVVENVLACQVDLASGTFSGLVHVQDRQHRYLVLLSVDGGYHGPGALALVPWAQTPVAGARDGLAKIVVQQDRAGSLWRSTTGSLTINTDGNTGSLLADLDPVDTAVGPRGRIRLDGPWRCSAGTG